MKGWDASSGIRYAGRTVLKLAILYAIVIIMCILALRTFCKVAGIEVDPVSLVSESMVYAISFLPLPLIALLAGGFAPGDRRRMAARMLMSTYIVAAILFVTGDLSYSLHGIAVPHESGAVVDSASLAMTTTGFAIILTLVPILSAIDALLEWRWGSDQVLEDRCRWESVDPSAFSSSFHVSNPDAFNEYGCFGSNPVQQHIDPISGFSEKVLLGVSRISIHTDDDTFDTMNIIIH